MAQRKKINKYYQIGDKLVCIKKFQLDDIYHKRQYHVIGDEFIIMGIHHDNNFIKFSLNSWNGVFKWLVDYKNFDEFEEYLVKKQYYLKKIRNLKLKQLNEQIN